MDGNKKLGRELKLEIVRQGYSIGEFAEKLHISQSNLSNSLTGQKRLYTERCEEILDALGLELVVQAKKERP